MPAITICPLCRKSLVVPEDLDRDARVRCPLCTSEYALALVLADVVDVPLPAPSDDPAASPVALPPEFVPVARGAVLSENVDDLADDLALADLALADLVLADLVPDDLALADLALDKPVADTDSRIAAATADPPSEASPAAEDAPAPAAHEEPAEASAASGSWPADDDGFTLVPATPAPNADGFTQAHPEHPHPADADGFTLGHPEHASPGDEAPHDVSHLDFIPGAGAGGESGLPVSRALSDWRAQQQKSTPSRALAKFIGVAVAGVLGVSLAYLAMSWANPAKFDFLRLWGRSKTAAPSNGDPPSHPPTEADDARWR